jgi:hypothetical protein
MTIIDIFKKYCDLLDEKVKGHSIVPHEEMRFLIRTGLMYRLSTFVLGLIIVAWFLRLI